MSKSDSKDDRQTRIENLKRKVKDLIGEEFVFIQGEICRPEVEEKFWESVLLFETEDHSSPFEVLVNEGLVLPPPHDLDDQQLTGKLWEVIQALSLIGVFLYNTDHLNDRELYEQLWRDILREEGFVQPANPDYAYHVDLIGSGSEEDSLIYLKYYADEEERHEWASRYPQEEIPRREPKPCDRDRHLPKREAWGKT